MFVSRYVIEEAKKGDADQVGRRMEVVNRLPVLDVEEGAISEIAQKLIDEHALPENEVADAFHIATAAFYKMDALLTWNCRHMANEFTLPKTYNLLHGMGTNAP